ncbi:MAG: guanylate kinase [Ignavibacteria bacterium]|nr:guanylate kinase [Ignavibacteria bacterium]
MLFVFSAPSGSGKTTVVKEILKIFPEFRFSISATSRKKRDIETDKKDYFFISKEDFEEKIKNNEFIEYELIYDNNYYGTLKSQVDECLNNGENMVFDMDVKGALSLKRIYRDKAVLIFVNPPDRNAIIQRLKNRGTETEETLNKRIARIDFEMAKKDEFDYVVNNDTLKDAVEEAKKIINKYYNTKEQK